MKEESEGDATLRSSHPLVHPLCFSPPPIQRLVHNTLILFPLVHGKIYGVNVDPVEPAATLGLSLEQGNAFVYHGRCLRVTRRGRGCVPWPEKPHDEHEGKFRVKGEGLNRGEPWDEG
jgi:hypothetical protein